MSNEEIAKEVKSLLDETTNPQPRYEQLHEDGLMSSIPRRETVKEPFYESPVQPQPQYQEPLKEEPLFHEPISPSREFSQTVSQKVPMKAANDISTYEQEMQREKLLHQKLVEETQQLRRQLDEYEDELTDLSDGVEKNNRILNVILCCLILALLGVIAFVIIMLVKAGGTL